MAGFVVILTVRVATVSEVDRSVCGVCIGGQEEGGQKKHYSHGGHPAKEKIELQALKLEKVSQSWLTFCCRPRCERLLLLLCTKQRE